MEAEERFFVTDKEAEYRSHESLGWKANNGAQTGFVGKRKHP